MLSWLLEHYFASLPFIRASADSGVGTVFFTRDLLTWWDAYVTLKAIEGNKK